MSVCTTGWNVMCHFKRISFFLHICHKPYGFIYEIKYEYTNAQEQNTGYTLYCKRYEQ